ncbi:DNA mismatch repair protein MutS [Fructobacillus pseudoficulneus]|uniref:DNA mismatch repair protein MutS n=1 Tax=Fructobacillus pseudoficulneus TaxID=220714 RepID=A0A3F3GRL7_9LACO|nr:DNA mismatch repair protein MutS [Fructobacillus pseudoficulneus]GAP02315.1 DNA mismatch repair protein MutS [Fructobacillus pseudoficulneus]SEH36364.1 DNA mismatch repair protein MutS [Fructobacillus pseudoficulneus]
MATKEQTPMMVQYHQIKDQYPDAFVFYRMGDFYELFEDDAIKGAKILELTLTARNKNSENPIPMAGIPHHAVAAYIDILVDAGHKVAIVEQMEDPATAKGMVKRDVVQLITPGTKMSGKTGDGKENNFLAAVVATGARPGDADQAAFALAYIDLSTGELKATELDEQNAVIDELGALEVKEVVLAREGERATPALADAIGERGWVVSYQGTVQPSATITYLTKELKSAAGQDVTALLLQYLFDTQKRSLDHIMPVQTYQRQAYLVFNQVTRVNLDLVENARTKQKAGSLFALLDETKTAMGGRLLKQWLIKPLKNLEAIRARQDAVAAFKDDFFTRGTVQDQLKYVYDLERLAAKAALGTLNARDLVQLKRSLQAVPDLQAALLAEHVNPILQEAGRAIDPLLDLASLIDQAIVPEPPISVRDGDLIQPGYDELVDSYNQALADNQDWLAAYQQQEREATGISNLKVKYNKNFGYFIEVTKVNLDKLEEGRYHRKQTLTNAERFTTPELKEHEDLIFAAQTKRFDREYELFLSVRAKVKEEITRLQTLAQKLARLDVLAALADVAENRHFTKPSFKEGEDRSLMIKQGRHPVIESLLGPGEYVANDVTFADDTKIQLVTGPNMAGKSTYMRQVALVVVLAQMGSFVPADETILPIFDQIFTRIGANDDLVNGRSTFMVEMAEANLALQDATAQSLILFDELGRGTATYDGMALAQAIIEYLDTNLHATTIFATHYHELTALANNHPAIQNFHVGAQLTADGQLHFLHQVQPGAADRSYGIQVAALAGLPKSLLHNAEQILQALEAQGAGQVEGDAVVSSSQTVAAPITDGLAQEVPLFNIGPAPVEAPVSTVAASLDPADQKALDELDRVNLNQLTPLAALNLVAKLQEMRSNDGQNS